MWINANCLSLNCTTSLKDKCTNLHLIFIIRIFKIIVAVVYFIISRGHCVLIFSFLFPFDMNCLTSHHFGVFLKVEAIFFIDT